MSEVEYEEVLEPLEELGFELYVPELSAAAEDDPLTLQVINGFSEFREHLGGGLTVMLLSELGTGTEVQHIDKKLTSEAVRILRERQTKFAVPATLN